MDDGVSDLTAPQPCGVRAGLTPTAPPSFTPTENFYFTADDGYLVVEYFANPEDEHCGDVVCFVDAGDTVLEILGKIVEYQRKRGTEEK